MRTIQIQRDSARVGGCVYGRQVGLEDSNEKKSI
jgi:hypothetical protein